MDGIINDISDNMAIDFGDDFLFRVFEIDIEIEEWELIFFKDIHCFLIGLAEESNRMVWFFGFCKILDKLVEWLGIIWSGF